jgi:hypothetical protein
MDLCITAVSIGRLGELGTPPSHDQTLFFSKKTTPNYSVAEAVRRSVSLPFAFYPLTLEENNGSLPEDILPTRPTSINPPIDSLPDLLARGVGLSGGLSLPDNLRLAAAPKIVDYDQHRGALLQDGGFRVNLPIGVFRDRQNRFMDDNYDAAGVAKRVLFAFNLEGSSVAQPRPDGVPPQRVPQPLRGIESAIGNLTDFVSDVGDMFPVTYYMDQLPAGPQPPNPLEAPGARRLLKVMNQVFDYATGGSAEQQVVDLLAAAEKTVAINIPVQDAGAAVGDNRGGSGDFGVPRITRKWWAYTSWQTMRDAFGTIRAEAPTNKPLDIGIGDTIQPYLHQLKVEVNTTPNGQASVVVKPRAAWGDALFSDDPDLKVSARLNGPSLVFGVHRATGPRMLPAYFGSGMVWLQTRDSDRTVSAADYIDINVNLPVRVMVLYFEGDRLPAALRNTRWVDAGPVADVDRVPLRIRRRDFPAGRILIPGPATTGANMHQHNYAVLLLPL